MPLLLLLLHAQWAAGRAGEWGEGEVVTPLGSSLSLLCDPLLQAPDNATAHWFKDSTPLGRVSGDRNLVLVPRPALLHSEAPPSIGLLIIGHVLKQHSGDYWCQTEDGRRSRSITVQVAYLETGFGLEPGWTLGEVGQRLRLHCRAPDGYPQPSVHWLKNGERLGGGGGDLLIRSFQEGDEGRYTCVAHNVVGRRTVDGFVAPPSILPLWREPVSPRCSRVSLCLWFLAGSAVSAAAVALYSLSLLICCPNARFKRRRWVIQGSQRESARDPAFLPASHVLRPV